MSMPDAGPLSGITADDTDLAKRLILRNWNKAAGDYKAGIDDDRIAQLTGMKSVDVRTLRWSSVGDTSEERKRLTAKKIHRVEDIEVDKRGLEEGQTEAIAHSESLLVLIHDISEMLDYLQKYAESAGEALKRRALYGHSAEMDQVNVTECLRTVSKLLEQMAEFREVGAALEPALEEYLEGW